RGQCGRVECRAVLHAGIKCEEWREEDAAVAYEIPARAGGFGPRLMTRDLDAEERRPLRLRPVCPGNRRKRVAGQTREFDRILSVREEDPWSGRFWRTSCPARHAERSQ